jgi:hypothetical protein
VLHSLRELRGAGRRVRDADPDARFLMGVTMIALPVGEQKIMYRQQPHAAEGVN